MADFELMNGYLSGATTFPLSLFYKGQGPIDVRAVASKKEYLEGQAYKTYFNNEAGTAPYWYVGMLVSCEEDGNLYILKSEAEGFVLVGKETIVSLTATNHTAALALATAENIGKVIIVAEDETVTEGESSVEYVAGAYIVTAANTVMYLATSSGTGDDITIINNAIANINNQLAHLDSYSIVEADEPTAGAAKTYELVKSGWKVESGAYVATSAVVGTIDIPEVPEFPVSVTSVTANADENGNKYLEINYSNDLTDQIKLEDLATGDDFITVSGSHISLEFPVLVEALGEDFVTKAELTTLVSDLTEDNADDTKVVSSLVYNAETGKIECTKFAKYQVFTGFETNGIPTVKDPSYITSYLYECSTEVTTGEGEQAVTETVVYGYEEWIYTTGGWKMLSRPINPYEVVYHSDLVPISNEDIENLE